MNRDELHPVEALLLIGLVTVEATITVLRTLLVPAVALLLVLPPGREQPCSPPPPEPPAAPPAAALPVTPAPCLADVAESLLVLSAAQLRELACTRRRLSKHALVAQLVALPI